MSDQVSAAVAQTTSSTTSQIWSPKLIQSLIACVIGGFVGCALVHSIDPFFKFANIPELGISPPPELVKKFNAAKLAFWCNNLALNFGLLGFCLGAGVGFSTEVRRIPSVIAGAVGGMLAGAVAGYLSGMVVARTLIASGDQSLIQSTLLHFAQWSSMFATILLLVGFVQSGPIRALNCALVGLAIALVVAVFYNILSSLIFPQTNLLTLIPESRFERFIWILSCSIVFGMGLHHGLNRMRPSNPTKKEKSIAIS